MPIDAQTKVDLDLNLAQLGSQKGTPVQSLLEVTFLLNLFYSNTILAKLAECSIIGKT